MCKIFKCNFLTFYSLAGKWRIVIFSRCLQYDDFTLPTLLSFFVVMVAVNVKENLFTPYNYKQSVNNWSNNDFIL